MAIIVRMRVNVGVPSSTNTAGTELTPAHIRSTNQSSMPPRIGHASPVTLR